MRPARLAAIRRSAKRYDDTTLLALLDHIDSQSEHIKRLRGERDRLIGALNGRPFQYG